MNQSQFKIQIINPCAEDWNAMQAESIGRFCDSCAKSVIDFTTKSDTEIKAYFQDNRHKNICGRFQKQQVDRIRIEIDKQLLFSGIPFWQKFLAVFLVCFGSDFLGVDFCFAQEQDSVAVEQVQLIDTLQIGEKDSTVADILLQEADCIEMVKPQLQEVTLPHLWIDNPVIGSVTTTTEIVQEMTVLTGFAVFESPENEISADLAPETKVENINPENLATAPLGAVILSPLKKKLPSPKNSSNKLQPITTPEEKKRRRRKSKKTA